MSNRHKNGYFLIEMLIAIALLALFLSILARYQGLSWRQHQQIVVRTEALVTSDNKETIVVSPSMLLRTKLDRLFKKTAIVPDFIWKSEKSG